MGAWGLGLFENDSDADHVCDFSAEAGVDLQDPDNYAEARRILDRGVLANMVKKRMPDATNPSKISRGWGVDSSPDYVLVILGAYAMTVGAKLPGDLREFMEKKWRELGLQRDGKIQMEYALKEYKDGVPFDFYSKELEDKMVAAGKRKVDDRLYPDSMLMNMPLPGQDLEQIRAMNKKMQESLAGMGWSKRGSADQAQPASPASSKPAPQHPADSCGSCGTKMGPLLKCSGCKTQLYCNKDCQKEHWKWHKNACKA